MTRLLTPTFLFRFSAPCAYRAEAVEPIRLTERDALPAFAALDGQPPLAEVRAAWSERGLAFTVEVRGKQQHPWCRESQPDSSDGVRLWIDTRDTHNVHRATRFCHQFVFLPAGRGPNLDEPVAEQLAIHRARDQARAVPPGVLAARKERRRGGYVLDLFVPGQALTGWDPAEHRKLGFTYAVLDRELGEQVFVGSAELPYREDPSLWGTLELER